MPADHQEVEWQFDTADMDAVERWLLEQPARDGFTITANPEQPHHDVYFDTADLRFVRAGYALRVRREGDHAEATLKSLTPPGEDGVRRRREVTEALSSVNDTPRALLQARGEVGQRVRAVTGSRNGSRDIHPLFEVLTRRRQFTLSLASKSVGVVALDRTEIRAPGAAAGAAPGTSLNRVEVEAGDATYAAALQDFVQDLSASCALVDARTSKFEAGLRASGLQPPAPPDLGPTAVKRKASAGELAFAVLRRYCADILAQEPGARLGDDPEAVHDMRVAARRSRTLLGLFADYLPAQAAPMREELHWLAQALGEVRDLDVQLDRLDGWSADLSPQDCAALDALRALLAGQRAAARKHLLAALDSQRYEQWVHDYTHMLRQDLMDGSAEQPRAATKPALQVLPALIQKRFRNVRRRGEQLNADSAPADYHALRLQAKRLRDMLDSVDKIYPRPIKLLVKRLGALQDLLGQHQDAQVAMAQLRELNQSRKLPPQTIFVMGEVAQRYEQSAAALRQQAPKAYRALKGKPWQRLKRAMAKRQ